MSPNAFPHLYVQRLPDAFVVRQSSGREPLPSDEIVQRFEQREDAHVYANVMNETQAHLTMHQGGRIS